MKTAAVLVLVITCTVPFVTACGSTGAISRTIDDATITTRVKTALLNDPVLDATKIEVETSAGVVTLGGVVKSKEEETKAIELTRRVTGVREVKSSLQVQPVRTQPSTPQSGFVPAAHPASAELPARR